MAHPYRTTPLAARARPAERRLGFATFVFGFLCVLLGAALSGPPGALVATLAGFVLLVVPPPAGAGVQPADDGGDDR